MLDGNRLSVLENFVSDRSLPKFADEKKRKGAARIRFPGEEFDSGLVGTGDDHDLEMSAEGRMVLSPRERHIPFFKRFFMRIAEFLGFTFDRVSGRKFTIQEYFSNVKASVKELEIISSRAEGYERALAAAKASGQRALWEQLTDGLRAYRYESQMIAAGITKYVTEDDMILLYKLSPVTKRYAQRKIGALRLDWIRNYTRMIPPAILAKKQRADELGLFDNYCVLHFDPDGKSFELTNAQKQAKKDPILFGVLRGQKKLYIIGDWIDEICDFDLTALADALGKNAIREFVSYDDTTVLAVSSADELFMM